MKRLPIAFAILTSTVLAQAPAGGRGGAPAPQAIQQVKPGLFMITGAGGNTTVRVTSEGPGSPGAHPIRRRRHERARVTRLTGGGDGCRDQAGVALTSPRRRSRRCIFRSRRRRWWRSNRCRG